MRTGQIPPPPPRPPRSWAFGSRLHKASAEIVQSTKLRLGSFVVLFVSSFVECRILFWVAPVFEQTLRSFLDSVSTRVPRLIVAILNAEVG